MTNNFLPYGRQVIEDDDVAAVAAVLRSEMLTMGPVGPAFEVDFCAATGAGHAVSCANGTAALHLAATAIGLAPGMTAIVPAITFVATANAVRMCGADVVFADVDPETGLMTPSSLRSAIDSAKSPVRAVFVVSIGGQVAELPEISEIADSAGAVLVEDACHALGTTYRVGNEQYTVGDCRYSIASVFSLHPVKSIAGGEGGVVTTNSAELDAKLRLARNHGIVRDAQAFTNDELALASDGSVNPWYYEMPDVGFNYRLSDIHAALACSQLAKLPRFKSARQKLAAAYDSLLADLAPVVAPLARVSDCDACLHLYQVRIRFSELGLERAKVMRDLRDRRIGTQVHYIPVNRQPYYVEHCGDTSLPGADQFYARTLTLPLFPTMTEDDVKRVVGELAAVVGTPS